jgi:two-component system LytT family response regulator
MIKTIIIDDEIHCLDTLSIQLADFCPAVQVVEQCVSARQGLTAIQKHAPALVFLDIEMPSMNGFELLEHFPTVPFAVVFTTSYDQYAIRAIRFSALDYLLKPVDPKELVIAVNKIENQKHLPLAEQFHILLGQVQGREGVFQKIAIPTSEGFELIPADQLVRCEANDNYTILFLKDRTKIVACRCLKDIEDQLTRFSCFVRVHNSHIVNLNEVIRYIRGEGGYLVMSDDTTVNVSRSRKETLLKNF